MVKKKTGLEIKVNHQEHINNLIASAEFIGSMLVLQATDYPPLDSYLNDVDWSKQHEHTVIYNDFIDQLESVKLSDIKSGSSDIHLKMQFSYSVTLMESCLSEMIKSVVMQHDTYRRNAINKIDFFKTIKIDAPSLLDQDPKQLLDNLLMNYISRINYHQVEKVTKLYESIIGEKIIFRSNKVKKNTSKLIEYRHDIVHRNGKNKKGDVILLTDRIVNSYIDDIQVFVEDVHTYIKNNVEK